MYERFSVVVPKRVLASFRREMDYLGIAMAEQKLVGFLVAYGVALAIGLGANSYYFLGLPALPIGAGVFLFMFGLAYLWLSMAADARGKFVETVLPDALQLIASNIKSGITTERALLVSARPEFGPLEIELRRASKKVLSGMPLEMALREIPGRIRSRNLERTIGLLVRGVQSGGQLVELLTQLSDDLRDQMAIDEEVKANISIYIMLIFFAAVFGAPLLFGVSSFIVQILEKQMVSMPELGTTGATVGGFGGTSGAKALVEGFSGGGDFISSDFAYFFSAVALFVTSVFAALTMGIINTGKEKGGVKFIPVILVIAFAVFYAVRWMLTTMFSAML